MLDPNDPLTVQVYLDARSYDIAIGSGEIASVGSHAEAWIERIGDGQPVGRKALVVTDAHVRELHADKVVQHLQDAGWECQLHELPAGEGSKALARIAEIYDHLVEMKADRGTVVFAVGGGVVGDAAGFVAATYARGIPFVQIPTTLLAHVDSSVGGKVGINHPRGKNLIGAFYQPLGVLIDTETLKTLPAREYRSGLAEVIKYGVILDREFFEFLEHNIAGLNERSHEVLRYVIFRCCRLKADVVEQDEFERTGLRAVLNYGHTFAHAFEALLGYGELLHGEAVAVGMVCASRLAEKMGLVDAELTRRQVRLLEAVGLPVALPAASRLTVEDVMERMLLDKKVVAGRLRFVLPVRMGEVQVFKDVDPELVRAVLSEMDA